MKKTFLRISFALATLVVCLPAAWSQNPPLPTEEREAKKADVAQSTTINVDGGKIVIVGKDGEKKEIDLEGARSITITQSAKSVVRDGEQKQEAKVRIGVVAADGEAYSVELDNPPQELGGNLFQFRVGPEILARPMPAMPAIPAQPFPGVFGAERTPAELTYFIGVSCQPLDEDQKAKFNILDDAGLIIFEISENSPAQAAELKVNDVLLFANETPLTEIIQLIDEVQKAGAEDKSVALTLIRDNKEMTVKVKPAKRVAVAVEGMFEFPGFPEDLKAQLREIPGALQLERVGPGVIRFREEAAEAAQQMKQQMEEMRREMLEMQQRMRAEMDEHMRALREQIEGLRRDK